jgi:hypothetical protein
MSDKKSLIAANIRLIILRALAEEEDTVTLNDYILQVELARFGYNRTCDFIANELNWLEKEVGAVRVSLAGTSTIATLAKAGKDHLARRRKLTGVQYPSEALDL